MAENYNYDDSLVSGETARATDVGRNFEAVESGFETLEAILARCYKVPVGETQDQVITNTPTDRATKIAGFDSNGNATVLQQIGVWRSDWETAFDYEQRDLVAAGDNSSIYICLTDHESGTFATDLDVNRYWALVIDLSGITIKNAIVDNTDSPVTAVAGDDYMVDTSGGAVTINLPASPAIGDAPITITHIDGTVGSSNLIIGRSGNNIMGAGSDLEVTVANDSFRLMYSDASRGWRRSPV